MKFEPIFLYVFNQGARLFGVLAILVGIAFLVSAYAIKDNRVIYFCVGVLVLFMGFAFLWAKSLKSKDLDRITPPPN